MKLGPAVLAALPLLLSPWSAGTADAGNLTTTFSFQVYVGHTQLDVVVPTADGMRIMLPHAFDSLNCTIGERGISDDGAHFYQNVVCTDPTTGLIVGNSVACPAASIGKDVESFFLRRNGSNVDFYGACETRARVTAPAARTALDKQL